MCRHQVAVKLIAGHSAGGERRGSRPGRPDAAGVPGLHSGQAPEPGHKSADDQGRRPWIIQPTGPRQAAKPGNVTTEPTVCSSVRWDAWEDVAARSVRTLSRHHGLIWRCGVSRRTQAG
jgi:hypothetical protein